VNGGPSRGRVFELRAWVFVTYRIFIPVSMREFSTIRFGVLSRMEVAGWSKTPYVKHNHHAYGDPLPRKAEGAGSEVSPPTITPVLVAELLAEGERMPVYVHVIDHPDARVLVDTGMTELHAAVADLDPRLIPLSSRSTST
jgi:hypothetical protein